MSRTLFWYVLRDLLRIFLMTSMVLAGIMSFGGLLRPLTQYGLSGTQVGQMLLYFMPATQTYSLPIAALFATTVVYGRLSADNELTACRAAGISYLTMAIPAFVLGLVLALVSLVSLSFVVPYYTLKVEKVAFSSLADLVQKNIQRSHQLKFPGIKKFTIYAERAEVLPPSADRPGDEVVILYDPMICRIERDEQRRMSIPSEFYTATTAQVVIHQGKDGPEFSVYLSGGVKFPRSIQEFPNRAGVSEAQIGPIPIPSLIKENTKFKTVTELHELSAEPTRGREVRELFDQISQEEQQTAFRDGVREGLSGRERQYTFVGADGETYVLAISGGRVGMASRGVAKLGLMSSRPEDRSVRLTRLKDGIVLAIEDAHEAVLKLEADPQKDVMRLEFELSDVLTPEGPAPRSPVIHPFAVKMPPKLSEIAARSADDYMALNRKGDEGKSIRSLQSTVESLRSGITAELHGRASFAVSCLILVMVGCALGMMFRTGNYLSAFALSVIPALICIALVVTGQHVSENDARNLKLGLGLIWGGNVAVLALAIALLARLQKE